MSVEEYRSALLQAGFAVEAPRRLLDHLCKRAIDGRQNPALAELSPEVICCGVFVVEGRKKDAVLILPDQATARLVRQFALWELMTRPGTEKDAEGLRRLAVAIDGCCPPSWVRDKVTVTRSDGKGEEDGAVLGEWAICKDADTKKWKTIHVRTGLAAMTMTTRESAKLLAEKFEASLWPWGLLRDAERLRARKNRRNDWEPVLKAGAEIVQKHRLALQAAKEEKAAKALRAKLAPAAPSPTTPVPAAAAANPRRGQLMLPFVS